MNISESLVPNLSSQVDSKFSEIYTTLLMPNLAS